MSNRQKVRLASGPHAGQSGSCIACLKGTDTGLAVNGDHEWMAAFLVVLGVPTEVAVTTIERFGPELDGSNRADVTFKVCRACGSNAPRLPSPVLVIPGAVIPCIRQP